MVSQGVEAMLCPNTNGKAALFFESFAVEEFHG
jgi:hypothetical protein